MNSTGHWKYHASGSGDYSAYHKSGSKAIYSSVSDDLAVGAFDKGNIVVTGMNNSLERFRDFFKVIIFSGIIQRGCTPILRVQIFHDMSLYSRGRFGFEAKRNPLESCNLDGVPEVDHAEVDADHHVISEPQALKDDSKDNNDQIEEATKRVVKSEDNSAKEEPIETVGEQTTAELATKFVIFVAAGLAALILSIGLLILLSMLAKKRRERNRFRGP